MMIKEKKENKSEDGSAMQEWIRKKKSTEGEDEDGEESQKEVRDETRTLLLFTLSARARVLVNCDQRAGNNASLPLRSTGANSTRGDRASVLVELSARPYRSVARMTRGRSTDPAVAVEDDIGSRSKHRQEGGGGLQW
jgi:hypothetical protein